MPASIIAQADAQSGEVGQGGRVVAAGGNSWFWLELCLFDAAIAWAANQMLLGDVNGDGTVNGLDVDPFVDVLLNGPFQAAADMNEDGEVNGLDVDPFVAAVVGGGAAQVPEPATLLLALVALGMVGLWRKFRRA